MTGPRPVAIRPAADPLPARSVLLSVLLGSHPPELPVRTLVRTGELFAIAEGTVRVALSRLAADGEVISEEGSYRLSERHLDRQRTQDSALRPATRRWRGSWLLAVVGPEGDRAAPVPAELKRVMERARMAELRPGVWTRPDNLAGPDPSPPASNGLLFWTGPLGPPGPSPADLAARLWDLEGWTEQAESLLGQLGAASEPADRLAIAAAMVRHIRADPVLPTPLLPLGWPGRQLRRAYDGYRAELGRLIAGAGREHNARHRAK